MLAHQLRWLLVMAALGLTLLATFVLYRPALSGSFHFDDAPNLHGLAAVSDRHSAVAFAFGGHAGPLGRPLALASFLPQADAWPDHPRPFLLINLLIHLVNGVLVAALSYHLARALEGRVHQPALFALTAALLWLIQPINASASLMVIQRMTTLAALFLLAGLVTYTLGRLRLSERPKSGLLLMTLGIAVFTPLATFTKENGALLPVYVLVLEVTLLRRLEVPLPRLLKAWRYLFLVLPTLGLAGYVASSVPPFSTSYEMLPFGIFERVTSQAYALVDYLRIAFIPSPLAITPSYDDYPLLSERLPSFVGSVLLAAWIALAGLAVWQRRLMPVLSFGVLWFLAGHALESTVLPLELFHLHRNYLPSFALVFLIVYFFFARSTPIMFPARFLLAPYIGLIAWVLFETTSTWGRPDVAGELWLIDRPSSMRAAEFLAERYRQRSDEHVADKIMRASFSANSNDTGAALEYLRTFCPNTDPARRDKLTADMIQLMEEGAFTKRTTQKLDSLVAAWERGRCPVLDARVLHSLLDGLFANDQFKCSGLQVHNLHLIRFRLHYSERAFEPAVSNLIAAYEIYPNNETLRLLVEVLESGGLYQEALDMLDRASPPHTFNPIKARIWQDEVDGIRALLRPVRSS